MQQIVLVGLRHCVRERRSEPSAGQRQRIGIARALYKAARLLILDEATGALDRGTEFNVMESIKDLADDITMVVVSHRLSTLEGCNPIIQLESGRVAAETRLEKLASC